MKLTTFLLLASIMTVSASSMAQKVTVSFKNTTLETAFNELKKQTGYDFVYDETQISDKKVTLKEKNVTVDQALTDLLRDLPLDFVVADKVVTIKPRAPSLLDKLKSALNLDKIAVTGKVVDENNQPLSAASVIVKGTSNSTTTDAKGNFTLKNVDPQALVVVTFIGYAKQEIKAASDIGTIKLQPATNPLDEVKVIAYGQTTERLSVGDVSTVSAKDIEEQPVTNPLLALEGRVPGLFITQTTGFSNSGVTTVVQGLNSISQGNDPFYVIDGVPYTSQLMPNYGSVLGNSGNNNAQPGNPLSFINPSDIESISVLKDASATAIYGSRAANGAIIITTKKGKAGETKVDVNVQEGWGSLDRQLTLLNTQQYIQMRGEGIKNDGLTVQSTDYDINGFWNTSSNTNWQKVLLGQTAGYENYNATVSGGSETTQFLVGGTFNKQTTVFPGNFADQRGGLHFSLNNTSKNRKFNFQISGSYLIDNNQIPNNDPTYTAMTLPPDAPALYNKDGSINWALNSSGASTWPLGVNPIAYLIDGYQNKTKNLISSAVLSYELLPGLKIQSNFGYTDLQQNELLTFPTTAIAPANRPYQLNGAEYSDNDINSWIIEPELSYSKSIGHGKLTALLGGTLNQTNSNGSEITGSGYGSDLLLSDIQAASSVYAGQVTQSVYNVESLFSRVNYVWDERYIIDLDGRRDGSSRFGPANQFHDFEAAGLGWIFSQESLVKDNLSFLNYGKIRASYGTSGNDQIGNYQFMNLNRPLTAPNPYQGITALAPTALTNPFLEWENTKKLNLGLNLGFLNDKLLFSADYFRNRSSNELISANLPLIDGYSSITENLPATVQNSGWEFSLNTNNIKAGDFSWTTNFNLTVPENKLISFPDLQNSVFANSLQVGESITTFKVLDYAGVDPATGEYQFKGANGKLTSNPQFPTDFISSVNTAPNFYGALGNNFKYKQFELTFLFQFVKQIGPNNAFGLPPGIFGVNQPAWVLNAWESPGDKASIQRYDANGTYGEQYGDATYSTGGYADASYIRLKNVSFSWNFPKQLLQKAHINGFRVYVQGQNILTFTHYKGLDPETLSSSTLPPLRIITLGGELTL
jgi:TonB-linked SusC/RagA family outer membrane protein